MNRVARLPSSFSKLKCMFSEVAKTTGNAPIRREYLQFSKSRLVDFGELPHGEIPQALKFTRPSTVDKLSNGVRFTTQTWKSTHSAITVTIKTGSRQETLENSSVAQFAAHGALNGTSKFSKDKINEVVDSIGGNLRINVTRQLTQFTLSFENGFLNQAIEFLSEVVLRPVYDPVAHEAQKASIHKAASSMDPQHVALENVHYTSFRDHYFGQPSTGIRDNVYSISAEQVKAYHDKFYIGQNIVVSAAGDININIFKEQVADKFSGVQPSVIGEIPNSDKPYYTPSLMFQRDDEVLNSAFAVGFEAPSWNDPDFFAMQFFKRIIGSWRCDKFTGVHLNSAHLQYNSFHTYLGNNPDIILHKPFYLPYSDTGLFLNFIYGNELFNDEMSIVSQNQMSIYAQYINQAQVFRARNKYFNDLLEYNNPSKVSFNNSQHVAYLDRLISRTESARRVSHMNPKYVTEVATKWFWDKETSVTAWGNLHNLMTNAHYNRTFRRATLGDYSWIQVNWTH